MSFFSLPSKTRAKEPHDAHFAQAQGGTISQHVLPAGTVLFRRGEERHCAYLIDAGNVHIVGNDEGGSDRLLCVIGEGELFGEMALVDNMPRTAMAVTATECRLFVIPRAALQRKLEGLDPFVSFLMGILLERYRLTRIYLPESIKLDEQGAFLDKISQYEDKSAATLTKHTLADSHAAALNEIRLEQELQRAVDRNEFVLALEPILDLADRKIAGFESLIRWEHPERGLLLPQEFLGAAERTGLIRDIDQLMLEYAAGASVKLRRVIPHAFVSVNLSGINFNTMDIAAMVEAALRKTRAKPEFLHIEITEGTLIVNPELAEKSLRALKDLGISIALDDFGTGYSSLGYLRRFTIDTLKIDRSFVVPLHEDNRSIDIIRAIVALAKSFNLKVVAEGIEHEKDIAVLFALGCERGQGYLFSRALTLDEALRFAETYRPS